MSVERIELILPPHVKKGELETAVSAYEKRVDEIAVSTIYNIGALAYALSAAAEWRKQNTWWRKWL